jgi:pilus assembly protein CpaB
MRGVFGVVLAVGVGLAGTAVYLAQGYINQTESQLAAERQRAAEIGELVKVYVVNKPMAYGAVLTKEDVEEAYLQASRMPEGAFRVDAEDEEAILFPGDYEDPRFVLRSMEPFEAVLASKVTEPGEPAGLTGQLSAGMTAFAIKVDVSTGVSGFLQPGDRVDIYWTGQNQLTGQQVTQLIESAVRIVAVDQNTTESATGATVAQTVTVEAARSQVARLAQAQNTGEMSLSLVGNVAANEGGLIEVDQNGLLGIEEQQIIAQEAPEVCTIRERKGSETIETPIPCTN